MYIYFAPINSYFILNLLQIRSWKSNAAHHFPPLSRPALGPNAPTLNKRLNKRIFYFSPLFFLARSLSSKSLFLSTLIFSFFISAVPAARKKARDTDRLEEHSAESAAQGCTCPVGEITRAGIPSRCNTRLLFLFSPSLPPTPSTRPTRLHTPPGLSTAHARVREGRPARILPRLRHPRRFLESAIYVTRSRDLVAFALLR